MKKILLALFAFGSLGSAADRPVFEFHSNFWVNLHHFLYEQAIAKTPASSDSPEWRAAVDYYRREMATHDLLDDTMARINQSLAGLESAQMLKGSALPPELIVTLESAAPVYKAHLWPEHNQGNIAWIETAKPLLTKYAAALSKELAKAYQTEWPTDPIRVDVCEYASWAGAYTNRDPTHVTMSSTDPSYQGPAALEMLFHEASHAMVNKVTDALAAELKAQKKLFPRRAFWHAVLFYTAGETTQRHLEGYTQYGIKNGVFERGWPGALPVLEKDWKPYLDGKIDLTTAVRRMVADYGVPRNPVP
ncbi:MAG TPA: hypothetical protein VGV35_03150 [Bryobacteraceae bacterium]|nr:hypothetical protein [Bryobacteraceae bacterium]